MAWNLRKKALDWKQWHGIAKNGNGLQTMA
jgi:hypothetical protein